MQRKSGKSSRTTFRDFRSSLRMLKQGQSVGIRSDAGYPGVRGGITVVIAGNNPKFLAAEDEPNEGGSSEDIGGPEGAPELDTEE